MRQVLLAIALLLPGDALAQDPRESPTDRERIAIVAISAGRLGLLLPLSERWMLRPDFTTTSFRSGEPNGRTYLLAGLSVIRRSQPTEEGWSYLSARYAIGYDKWYHWDRPTYSHAITVTAGAHGRLSDWLSVFGEAGAGFAYGPELNPGDGDWTRNVELLSRIGIAVYKPRPAASAWAATQGSEEAIPKQGERPSWVVGGFGSFGGILLPFSERWLLRPDFALHVSDYNDENSREDGGAGLSVLRRVGATDRGWIFAAARYGLAYQQEDAEHPQWTQEASVTLGGQARLRGRLGVMAEAGLMFRYSEQRTPTGLSTLRTLGLVQRVGLTYRWVERTH
ncbi:MAG: hypothetical protein IPJ78_14835 [Gemmatimonadetes bacterium]|nr:hypothetical protein [Gemmatimonadota bacterium]